ncbi:MAG TPA: RidA family protein [Opitutaceae bacterium]|nr:RidA family protein [Opitutaceae bacterium]
MKKTLIYPVNHPAPRGAYSPGLLVEAGGSSTLFVTGQLAVDREGKVVAPFDAAAQTEFVFGLIQSVLEAAGMGFGDVVKVQTFLTHMPDFEKFSAVRNRFFADSRPVSTLLEVKGLAREGCCVEIEVVAIR